MKQYLLILLIILASCARAPYENMTQNMRPVKEIPNLIDSYSRESFFEALKKHVEVLKTTRMIKDPMPFGERLIPRNEYVKALEKLLAEENNPNYLEYIKNNFNFYEAYGDEKLDWSQVVATGYYEPKVFGSKIKTAIHSQPLYRTPDDLVKVYLKDLKGSIGRLDGKKIVPYYDRKEIDSDKKLHKKKLELAYVDPLDAFFIQIQGTGVVEFNEKESIRLGYSEQNGQAYVPIGKFLLNEIPLEEMSMQRIIAHLRTLTPEKQQELMNLNPSYVFFQELKSDALTFSGVEVSDHRTIATDRSVYPKGALAFLEIDEPEFVSSEDLRPQSYIAKNRLVFDQDTGGAIRGPGRIDIFMGKGDIAAQKAGVMKQVGKLYYLLPK